MWSAGRCCECLAAATGKCGNVRVSWARERKLIDQGMGVRNAAALSEICEHSEQWTAIEMVRGVLADDQAVNVRTIIKAVLENEEAGNV